MNSKTIWGDHPTSRWEFSDSKPKKNPNAEAEKTLADTLHPVKEIKNPNLEDETATESSSLSVEQTSTMTDSDRLGILLAATKDYIARDISTAELEEIINLLEE